MKKITIILLLLTSLLRSQTFTGTGGSILNNGGQETAFPLTVSGLSPANIDSTFGVEEVSINISHIAVEELHVYLQSPSGIVVDLTGVLCTRGTNFTDTRFNNSQLIAISTASAPYTGVFRPLGNLGRFNASKPGNGVWKLYVKDFVVANAGTLVSWSIKFSSTPAKPVILQSSNLPIVFINTNNQKLNDETETIVDLGIIDNGAARNSISDPKNNYNGKAAIKIRGSSSKMFEKNNMKIELRDNLGGLDVEAPLAGMPTESDWILTASYTDKTLIRNPLTQHLFQQMGHYAPRSRFVEVVLNGEYYGVYLLMEQIKRGKDRLNIRKMTPVDNQWPFITGGYIVQINRTDDPGWFSLKPGVSNTGAKFYYQYNYPKDDEITIQQQNYIKAVLDSFETVMSLPTFADPAKGYHKFIRENSFIDYLILNELCKNVDAYKLSTYLYKDHIEEGGKISVGPTWDYDLAWHNCNFGDADKTSGWQHNIPNSEFPIPEWWQKFMTDNAFKDRLYCRYHTLRRHTLSNDVIYGYVDGTATLIKEARERNYRQFPIIGAYVYPNPQDQTNATYEKEVDDLKQWVSARASWLDKNIPGFCTTVDISNTNLTPEQLLVFPNPFRQIVTLTFSGINADADISVSLCDMMGNTVFKKEYRKVILAEEKIDLDTRNLSAGSYVMNVVIGVQTIHKKVIKVEN
jgi:subtilisin-like proprotein convertase family protein